MAAVIQLTLAVDQNSADLVDELITQSRGDERAFLRALSRRLGAYAGGARPVCYTARVDDFSVPGLAVPGRFEVAVTQSALVSGTDVLAIGPLLLEWVSGSPGANEVEIGATDDECAANLAAAINALEVVPGKRWMAGLFYAEASGKTVTVTGYIDPRAAAFIPIEKGGVGQVIDTSEWGGGLSSVSMSGAEGSGISGALGIAGAW